MDEASEGWVISKADEIAKVLDSVHTTSLERAKGDVVSLNWNGVWFGGAITSM